MEIKLARALVSIIGVVATGQPTFAQDPDPSASSVIFSTTATAIAKKPYGPGAVGEDALVIVTKSESATASAGLGDASALIKFDPFLAGVGFPVIRARAAGSGVGEAVSETYGGKNPGGGTGRVNGYFGDTIQFRRAQINDFEPYYYSLDMEIVGLLSASVSGELTNSGGIGGGAGQQEASAGASVAVSVTTENFNQQATKSATADIMVGKNFPTMGEVRPIALLIDIPPTLFDLSKPLELIISIQLNAGFGSTSENQSGQAEGDLTSSIYFGGLKFYDKDKNLLPPGTISATGLGGIDYTLSNVPIGITIVEEDLTQDIFTVIFNGPPEKVNWMIKASTNLAESFSIDLTPSSTITETESGIYRADIDISGQTGNLFLRMELSEE